MSSTTGDDATTGSDALAEIVDTERHHLDEPGSAAWWETVDSARAELRERGCAVLTGFIRAERLTTLRAQGDVLAGRAHYDVETVNVYNTPVGDTDTALPADHPARTVLRRGNAFVARDLIPPDHLIHRLYTSPAFRRFVADCVDRPAVHELADPLSALVLNVVTPGRGHPWHFDTNEFTVTVLTRAAAGGGEFEYCPGIRSAGRENLADVRAVLDGRGGERIRRLPVRPGDLQLFAGRYSLHRVTEVTGTTARHTAIFAYSERPGVIGTVARTRQLFGRVTPAHEAAERVRVDQLLI